MDRRERQSDLSTLISVALAGWQSGLWTAMPGIVRSYDPAKMTCVVSVAIKMQIRDAAGVWRWEEITPLVDVPVLFPGGGGFTLTFPIAEGDEALVVFASRCIDSWWQSGGVQVQADLRLHSLSDGFAIIGPRSQMRKLSPAPHATNVVLRSDDGQAQVSIAPNKNISLTTNATIQLVAAQVNITGPVSVTGSITASGEVTGAGKALSTHTHGGVDTGSGTSGPPT